MNHKHWREVSQQEQYITRRVIDAFLREDIRDIVTEGELFDGANLKQHWPLDASKGCTFQNATLQNKTPQKWLKVSHLGSFNLYIPLQACSFIQSWQTQSAAWLFEQKGQFYACNHFSLWLEQLATGLNDEQLYYFHNYDDECYCAVEQKVLAAQLFEQQRTFLSQRITTSGDGWQQMSLIEQLAAHCDHPLYPSARAKFGMPSDAIERFCPEAMPQFELNWLAVPKVLYHGSVNEIPDIWPSFEQVGLSPQLAEQYQLVAVHPLTFTQYLPQTLSEWPHFKRIHFAPEPFLAVRPTLSVRTVALVERPEVHIKLPLPMRTLGSKNIRTIKPSTINDGFVFQQLLQHVAAEDEHLHGLYLHCDEQNGGHIDERPDLAWLIRRYPSQTVDSTPVCVAAFMAETGNGQLVIEQLAADYYQNNLSALLDDYFSLLLKVHLRFGLVYGIALESNQQNTMVLFSHNRPLQLLFRDNDAGRIYPEQFRQQLDSADKWLERFIDQRILVEGELPLIQMFTTINLQLNIGCIIAGLAQRGLIDGGLIEGRLVEGSLIEGSLIDSQQQYARLAELFSAELAILESQGYDTKMFRAVVMDAPKHYAKYLLSAASLMSKQQSQAADINKYYGLSAPNPLLAAST